MVAACQSQPRTAGEAGYGNPAGPTRQLGTSRLTEAYVKYDIHDHSTKTNRTGNPLKPTCPSAYFLQLSKTWDKGTRPVRERILQEFVTHNMNKTGPQLEREFSNGASLFLTRLSAWLRLTYLLGHNLCLQLQAINVFVSASSGHRFLAEFLEVGGVLTVLEILGLSHVKEPDKAEALRLLLSVAHAGRKYKEFICESYGVRAVADCLGRSRSEVTQDYARNLLYHLGIGNPKFLMQVYKSLLSLLTSQGPSPTSQQMAGQALRQLLPSIQTVHPSIVEMTITLLKNPHIQIQYEGYEILRDLISRQELQSVILTQLVAILKTSIEDVQEDVPEDRRRRGRGISEGKTLSAAAQWGGAGPKGEDIRSQNEAIASGYVQQAYAAKLLGVIAATFPELAEKMIESQVVSGLLNVIANVGHPDSQHYAANALIYLVETFPYVADALREHMGQNFFEILEDRPDTFYKELNREQVRYLRRNNVQIHHSGSSNSLSEWEESLSSDEEGDESSLKAKSRPKSAKSKLSVASRSTLASPFDVFPATREEQRGTHVEAKPQQSRGTADVEAKVLTPADAQESKDDGMPPPPPDVQDMYVPFAQLSVSATFSTSKFGAGTGSQPKEGFEMELEKFRNMDVNKGKDSVPQEFQLDPASESWLMKKKKAVDFHDVKLAAGTKAKDSKPSVWGENSILQSEKSEQ
ncbi:armadillo-type protein [Phlyctochytrium arcticum]|nr:armadillo-type protein [Phlyctochytrium arcticum]